MEKILTKKVVLAAICVVMLGGLIILRERISKFLSFKSDVPVPASQISAENQAVAKISGSAQTDNTIKTPLVKTPSVPAYTGREPTEVRPLEEEVKLFTEPQRRKIYETLETHGRSVNADPSFFSAWIQLGLFKKIIGDFEGAKDAWEYAGVLQPLNSLSFANLGELYWHYLNDFANSEKNLRISIKNKPSDVQTYVTLAELYYYSYTQKKDLADDVLLEGLAANPDNGTLLSRLAYIYEQNQEWSKSVETWQKFVNEYPDDADGKIRLEKARLKMTGQ